MSYVAAVNVGTTAVRERMGFDEAALARWMAATVEGYSPEAMEAPLTTDEGVTTRAERCRFMTLHGWYHLGQLNFVQTLLGDDAWHWM